RRGISAGVADALNERRRAGGVAVDFDSQRSSGSVPPADHAIRHVLRQTVHGRYRAGGWTVRIADEARHIAGAVQALQLYAVLVRRVRPYEGDGLAAGPLRYVQQEREQAFVGIEHR